MSNENDYNKNRNYWKYLKAKLKKENCEVVSVTTQRQFGIHPRNSASKKELPKITVI